MKLKFVHKLFFSENQIISNLNNFSFSESAALRRHVGRRVNYTGSVAIRFLGFWVLTSCIILYWLSGYSALEVLTWCNFLILALWLFGSFGFEFCLHLFLYWLSGYPALKGLTWCILYLGSLAIQLLKVWLDVSYISALWLSDSWRFH